jgi:glutaryl-CoA dehydrogenase
MSVSKGVDYLNADALLSDEERAIRDTIRSWVDDRVLPIIGEHFVSHRFPAELIPQMGEFGVFGMTLPERYGCAGLGDVAYGLVMQELERGDTGIRSFASVQSSLVMYPIHAFGNEEQKSTWLPRLARGESIGCFGLTEPDFGSNPAGMLTRAIRDGDDWILNGTKMWITNGSLADVAIVWAKTGELDDPHSIRGFIVETDRDGFAAQSQRGKLSLPASDTSELAFQDVRVPHANMLPESDGLRSALMCLNQARYGIAWGAVGAAMACYEEALSYGLDRIQFDRPIAGFQMQQARLVEMLCEITKAQLLCVQLGRLKERGEVRHTQISLAKRNNVSMACDVAREARRLLGANGISVEYASMRHMANLESVYTYEGTHDMHTLAIGKEITGLDAFSG